MPIKRREVEMKPTRYGYGEALVELGASDPNVVVLDADLSKSTMTKLFAEKYPERFFDMGIAEQDMLGTAAGLAIEGKIPFVSTYGVFVAGRAWDQIRTTICYSNLNVKIGGAHGGISVGPDGATHQALEEIATMRCIPNMTVIVPADAIETKKATLAAARMHGPVYLRFGRAPTPIFTKEDDEFVVGKARVLRDGTDVVIYGAGPLLYEALLAAEALEEDKGLSVAVINVHTVKPIDVDTIVEYAKKCGAAVTVEEHQVMGGFGSAVAEVIVQNHPIPMEFVGVQDRFGESGKPEELLPAFGLDAETIYDKVLKVLERKGN